MHGGSISFGDMEDGAYRLDTGHAPFFPPPQDTADPNTLFEFMKDRAVIYDPEYQIYYDPVQEVYYDSYSRSIQPLPPRFKERRAAPKRTKRRPASNVSP